MGDLAKQYLANRAGQLEQERDRQIQEARWETKLRIEGTLQRFIETLDAEIGHAEDFDSETVRAWLEPCVAEAISVSIERWQREQAKQGKVIL